MCSKTAAACGHEHVVTETDESREEARVLNTVIAENSLCETNGDYVEDLRNQNMAASAALAKALSVTRWEQGATSSLGSKSQNFYHMSARAAINAVAETWGGEVRTEISVGDGRRFAPPRVGRVAHRRQRVQAVRVQERPDIDQAQGRI